jgi:hypothetical protein
MSLDETERWSEAGSEMTCEMTSETQGETYNEMFNETCKRKMKNTLNPTCYIHGRWRNVTLAPIELLHFAEGN